MRLPILRFRKLGHMKYTPALVLQKSLVQKHLDVQEGNPDGKTADNVVLLVEHDPVYTIGYRPGAYTDEEARRLRALGAEFVHTGRGGLITFHGPRQLVAYPIVNPNNIHCMGPRKYVDALQDSVIDTCKKFGVKTHTSPDTGVWVGGDRKISAIGVQLTKRIITWHGLALNCDNDLTWYDHIVPCGIEGKSVTSLSREFGFKVTTDEVTPVLASCLAEKLNCHVVWDDEDRG